MGIENLSPDISREEKEKIIYDANNIFFKKIQEKIKELSGQISDVRNLTNKNFGTNDFRSYLKSICEYLLKFIGICGNIGGFSHGTSVTFNFNIKNFSETIDKCRAYIDNNGINFDLIENINAVINLLILFYNAIFDSVNEAKGEIMRIMFSKEIEDRDLLRNIKKDTYINEIESLEKGLYINTIKFSISILDQFNESYFDGEKYINLCNHKIMSYNDLMVIKNKILSLQEKILKKTEKETMDLNKIKPEKIGVTNMEIIEGRIKLYIKWLFVRVFLNKNI